MAVGAAGVLLSLSMPFFDQPTYQYDANNDLDGSGKTRSRTNFKDSLRIFRFVCVCECQEAEKRLESSTCLSWPARLYLLSLIVVL